MTQLSTLPTTIATLRGSTTSGAPSIASIPIVSVSGLSRRLGLFGDDVEVIVSSSDWPPSDADLSATARWLLVVGDTFESIALDGYVLRSVDDAVFGQDILMQASAISKLTRLRFSTFPALWRDGRGGRLSSGLLNPVDADGAVIRSDPMFRSNGQLVALCAAALGVTITSIDGVVELDALDPPAPLDWGNAIAADELDAVLARTGYAASPVQGQPNAIHIARLPRPGEPLNLPTAVTDNSEPYTLHAQPSLTDSTVVITSGATRAVVVEAVTLGSSAAPTLEWVWFDESTGMWRNDAETDTANGGPGGVKPGDIAAFRLGPGDTVTERAEFARLFSAVRFVGPDAAARRRMVTIPRSIASVGGLPYGGRGVTVAAILARRIAKGQFRNDPESALDPLIPLSGAVVDMDAGVIVLPRLKDAAYVRMANINGGYADAFPLSGSQITMVIAREMDEGDTLLDYFAAGWSVDSTGALVALTDTETRAALADAKTIVLDAPFLRSVVTHDGAGGFTALNGVELKAVAKRLGEIRVGASSAQTGIIHVRGLRDDIAPGDANGAISSVRWDLGARRTILSINEHVVPDSEFAALETSARRSIITGFGRFSLPGAQAARRGVRRGPNTTDGSASTDQESRGADRGDAPTRGSQRVVATTSRDVPMPTMTEWYARITGATAAGANKWLYDWEQVVTQDDGAFLAVVDGLTSVTHGQARNAAEESNTGAGVEGNGVDRANLPTTFTMQPIGPRVVVMSGPFGLATAPYTVFHATNSDDGACPTVPAAPLTATQTDTLIETLLLAGAP